RRRRMKATVPRITLRKIIKKRKPQLRLAANADLLDWHFYFTFKPECLDVVVHLNFILFLHRLAEEARTNAFEDKSRVIKSVHAISAAKVL
ncbi:CENPW protein, partial [Catharus fuscescens]|nr:CENPW protein [Catharus fuscescens]